ncbi:MAG: serine hydrolase domain-containing protein [Telluria sp.]
MSRLRPPVLAVALALAGCAAPVRAPDPAQIDAAITGAIAQHKLPGAVLHAERGDLVLERAWGRYTYAPDAPPMLPETVFDIASLSKVVATAPAVLLLAEAGKIDLEAPLARYLPDCGLGGITVRQLLTHTSGLPAGLPKQPPWHGSTAAHALACAQPAADAPGASFRYSDVNFVLLGQLVEQVSGEPLDRFVGAHIFAPLGMRSTFYRPLEHLPVARIAPTQYAPPDARPEQLHGDMAPGQVLQGQVHDPTARRMDGVAGSAGVFSTAGDLARYARMLLGGGQLDGVRVLSPESVHLLTTVQTPPGMATLRGMGMDIDTPYSKPRGSVFPRGSYGHTGFTGCILWVDPASRSFYIFLSNRVYPDDKANIVPLYGELGTLVARALQ